MAAAYGRLPQEILRMPFAHVMEWWRSFQKRTRRNWRMEASLRGIDVMQQMGGGGAPGRPPLSSDAFPEARVNSLLGAYGAGGTNSPFKVVRKED
jgi:hypothetical protein